jgi:hypothetical protein
MAATYKHTLALPFRAMPGRKIGMREWGFGATIFSTDYTIMGKGATWVNKTNASINHTPEDDQLLDLEASSPSCYK